WRLLCAGGPAEAIPRGSVICPALLAAPVVPDGLLPWVCRQPVHVSRSAVAVARARCDDAGSIFPGRDPARPCVDDETTSGAARRQRAPISVVQEAGRDNWPDRIRAGACRIGLCRL